MLAVWALWRLVEITGNIRNSARFAGLPWESSIRILSKMALLVGGVKSGRMFSELNLSSLQSETSISLILKYKKQTLLGVMIYITSYLPDITMW
jgi:hypothetical protein